VIRVVDGRWQTGLIQLGFNNLQHTEHVQGDTREPDVVDRMHITGKLTRDGLTALQQSSQPRSSYAHHQYNNNHRFTANKQVNLH